MRALLIYPPQQLRDDEIPRPDGSLGLLYVAAALERSGVSTDVLDASVGPLGSDLRATFYRHVRVPGLGTCIGMSCDEVGQHVRDKGYDIVGVSSMLTCQTRMAMDVIHAIRRHSPRTPILVGGTNAAALWDAFLLGGADRVCLGEAEQTIGRIVEFGPDLEPGWASRISGALSERFCPDDPNLDDLPLPAWDKLPWELYDRVAVGRGYLPGIPYVRSAPIATSRGCRWNCRYCHISGLKPARRRLRFHSLTRVDRELDILTDIGVRRVMIEDDSFTADKARASRILTMIRSKALIAGGANGVNVRDLFLPDGEVDESFLSLCVDSGLRHIVVPVESGSQRILNKYATGKVHLDRMNLPALVQTMTRLGIYAPVNMMLGFPDETEAEMYKTVELARRLREAGAPYVSFACVIPFPGSQLYADTTASGQLPLTVRTDVFNWKDPIMTNTTIPRERIAERRRTANREVNAPDFIRDMENHTVGGGSETRDRGA